MGEKAQQQRQLSKTEKIAAVVLIIGFSAMVVAMFIMRDDTHWDRMVVLFGSVEALVFGAAGALFGTSIQRSQTADAQEAADTANNDATTEREAAAIAKKAEGESKRQAVAGEMLRSAILAKEKRPVNDLIKARANLVADARDTLKADVLQRDFDELFELAKKTEK